MKRAWVPLWVGAALGLLFAGCATSINSPEQAIRIVSDPPEAEVWIDQRYHLTAPGMVRISRLGPHHAHFEKEGYEPVTITMTPSRSSWMWLNIVCLPAVVYCWNEDKRLGGYWTFDDEVKATLSPKNGSGAARRR
jgi:PEGA domain